MKKQTKKRGKKSVTSKNRKISIRKKHRLNPDNHPRDLYYTNLITYIQKNEYAKTFLKNRYGGFLMGIIDDMDASYSSELKKDKTLTPPGFIIWYISTGQDIISAKEIISDDNLPVRFRTEMKKLVEHLEKKNKF